MIEDLAVDHDFIGLGFPQDRLQPVTDFRFIADQRHAQRFFDAVLL